MTRSGTRERLAVAAASVTALVVAGCGMNRGYANNEIRQLAHTNVHIEYKWRDSPNEQAASALSDGHDSHTVSVTYPHPDRKYGRQYAQVTLRHGEAGDDSVATSAVSQLLTNPFKQQEARSAKNSTDNLLRLALPREELEFLLRDLVADSFFDREQRHGGVDLSVTLGSRTTQKRWDHIASFDQLASRVVTENDKRDKKRRSMNKVQTVGAELLAPVSDEASVTDP